MKTSRIYTLIATILIATSLSAQSVITISAPKFGRQLVERWAAAYEASHKDVKVQLVDGKTAEADFTLAEETSLKEEDQATVVGRYAVLPVVAKQNPQYSNLQKRSFGEKEIKRFFFQDDIVVAADETKKDAVRDAVTIYSGSNKHSASKLFAQHFGYSNGQLRGKRIAGDDIFLLTAISKDNTGITFNTLNYLYDLNSRKLNSNVALLNLKVKAEQEEALESGNLDKVIETLENGKSGIIPVGKIAIVGNSSKGKDFLSWVVSEGQKVNHEAGFLKIDEKTANNELALLAKR